MSLTATLLLGLPVRLPHGQVRLISTETRQSDNARNQETRLANVELVFNAVADGHTTIPDIQDETELSPVTIQKALHDLEDWPSGPRIVRTTGTAQQRHRFQVFQENAALTRRP